MLAQVDWHTATGGRNRAALELMYRCGLRVSEISNLASADVLWDQLKVFVRNGKHGRDRVVPYDAETEKWLRNWERLRHARCPWFFHTTKRTQKSKRHSQWSPRTVRAMVARYAERAGLEELQISPHTLRHTYATELLQEGANPMQVQKLLGHSDVSTTMIYTHVTDGELEEFIRGRAEQARLDHQPSKGALALSRAIEQLSDAERQNLAEMLGLSGQQ